MLQKDKYEWKYAIFTCNYEIYGVSQLRMLFSAKLPMRILFSKMRFLSQSRVMRVSRPQTTKRLRALRNSQQGAGTMDREEQEQWKVDEQFEDVSKSAATSCKDVQTIAGVLQATDLTDEDKGYMKPQIQSFCSETASQRCPAWVRLPAAASLFTSLFSPHNI